MVAMKDGSIAGARAGTGRSGGGRRCVQSSAESQKTKTKKKAQQKTRKGWLAAGELLRLPLAGPSKCGVSRFANASFCGRCY